MCPPSNRLRTESELLSCSISVTLRGCFLIETAFFVLEEIDGSPAEGVEFPLELSQVDGNLKVFTYDNVIPGLNPDGGNLVGTVYLRRGGVTKRQERLRAVYKEALRAEDTGD